MSKEETKQVFDEFFDKADKSFEFEDRFHNGTGYFDPLVTEDLGLAPGKTAASADEHGRLILVQGTPLGNIVVFQRYVEGDVHEDVLAMNSPDEIGKLTGIDARLSANDLRLLFGYSGNPSWGEMIHKASLAIEMRKKRFENALDPLTA